MGISWKSVSVVKWAEFYIGVDQDEIADQLYIDLEVVNG